MAINNVLARIMLNLDKYSIDIACPQCSFYNLVTLKKIRFRDAVICRGCKATINFEDHMNETQKATRVINRAMHNLDEHIRRIGKIKIRF